MASCVSIREDKRRLEKAKKRLADIDKLITRIYEDMVLGDLKLKTILTFCVRLPLDLSGA